jgi:hypothetical protein
MSLSPNLDPPQGNFLSWKREDGGGRERETERKKERDRERERKRKRDIKGERADNKNQVYLRKREKKKKEKKERNIPSKLPGRDQLVFFIKYHLSTTTSLNPHPS